MAIVKLTPIQFLESKGITGQQAITIAEWLEEYKSQIVAFKSKEYLKKFIELNTPFAVKNTRKDKNNFVSSFTSKNAFNIVTEELTNKFWEKLNN